VDVRVDERRREEAALGVELGDLVGPVDPDRAGGRDGDDPVALGPDVLERDVGARGRMDARVSDEQARRGSLPRPWSRRS
jgi:hypothetical protein